MGGNSRNHTASGRKAGQQGNDGPPAASMTASAATDHACTAAVASTPTLFRIVAIGASAGGLEAVTELLNHLPASTGLAFILVQHQSPQGPHLSGWCRYVNQDRRLRASPVLCQTTVCIKQAEPGARASGARG